MAAQPTMLPPGVLTCEHLLALTGYERVGDLKRALDTQHIRYFLGRDGAVWTTIDLVNAAGGMVRGAAAEPLDPELFR
jgi:hypothetical protein